VDKICNFGQTYADIIITVRQIIIFKWSLSFIEDFHPNHSVIKQKIRSLVIVVTTVVRG
jgi:hypothetical protein